MCMKERWKNPTEAMLKIKRFGRPKGAKNLKPSKPKCTILKIGYNDQIFNNAKEASISFNVDPVTIRRRCRLKIDGWSYV